MTEPLPRTRPPLLLGCAVIGGAFVLATLGFITFVAFLESGADSGEVTLEILESYEPGSVTRVPDRGFYVVAPPEGPLVALSDLDEANQAATGSRCRVAPIASNDPALLEAMDRYQARMSPAVQSMALIFREDCNGALYDGLGVRLDIDGPNLDRLGTFADETGRLVVDTASRYCSRREGADLDIFVECSD